MVVERRRDMKRNQAEEKEPDSHVHLQELLGERAVGADQRRQLAEEKQILSLPFKSFGRIAPIT
jgi:hypothetical protein